MKYTSLFAGLGVCLGIASYANATIYHGTVEGYFTKVYATDLTGTRLSQFDDTCRNKHWYLLNTPFYVEYRVNTEANIQTAHLSYAKSEHLLMGAAGKPGSYVFSTEQLTQSLKDLHAKKLYFTLDNLSNPNPIVQLVFESIEHPLQQSKTKSAVVHVNCHDNYSNNSNNSNCFCDCHQIKTTYQCVLSTH